jgi:hypothetical protein
VLSAQAFGVSGFQPTTTPFTAPPRVCRVQSGSVVMLPSCPASGPPSRHGRPYWADTMPNVERGGRRRGEAAPTPRDAPVPAQRGAPWPVSALCVALRERMSR